MLIELLCPAWFSSGPLTYEALVIAGMSRFIYRLRESSFLFCRPASPVRHFTQRILPLLDPSTLLEEETLPRCTQGHFYPVQTGAVLLPRYQVIGKLGFGAYSTVWRGRDLKYAHPTTLPMIVPGNNYG